MKAFCLAASLLACWVLSSCAAPPPVVGVAAIETGVDPQSWASVPAGSFLRGIHEEMADIPYDYEIMVTDVTSAQYAAYLNRALAAGTVNLAGGRVVGAYSGDTFHGLRHEEPVRAGDWLHYPVQEPGTRLVVNSGAFTPLAGYENHPMTMVTWFGARAYCEEVGARLPTEDEWEKAARGPDNRPYPWGDTLERSQANYYSSRDIFEKVFGKQGDTTPVGFYNGRAYEGYQTTPGVSPYCLYDMAGNVWQWVGNVYEGTHYRTLRGGSKADYGYNLRLWTRNSAPPDYYSPNVGFRCVRQPQP